VQRRICTENREHREVAVTRCCEHRAGIHAAIARQHSERLRATRVRLLSGDVRNDFDAAGNRINKRLTQRDIDAVPDQRNALCVFRQLANSLNNGRYIDRRNRRRIRRFERSDANELNAFLERCFAHAQIHDRRAFRRRLTNLDNGVDGFKIAQLAAAAPRRSLPLPARAPVEILNSLSAEDVLQHIRFFVG
jgi:hypothetical protein